MLSPNLSRQNPWWRLDADQAVAADPKLHTVEASSVRWTPTTIPFDFQQDFVYVLRGPRQVGKSTLLKLCVRQLLAAGRPPRRICYLDVESAGVTSYAALLELLLGYLDWVNDDLGPTPSDNRIAILLDEVTIEPHWSTAIRVLADEGRLRNVTLVATGSSAADLDAGGDRLPNRRGRGLELDWQLHPLSFRDYIDLTEPTVGRALPRLTGAQRFDPATVWQAAREAQLYQDVLETRFFRYLTTGGFLLAINEELTHQRVPSYVYDTYRSAILGEVARLKRSDDILRPVVAWLDGRLGQEFDWSQMAAETAAGTHVTMRELVTVIERAFVWHVYWRTLQSTAGMECAPALRSPKKLYPADPLTWHTLAAWSRGNRPAWEMTLETLTDPTRVGHLVESIVADHLRRMVGPYAYYYRNKDGQELDFVICEQGSPAGKLEVKYRAAISDRDRYSLRINGGGLLLSKTTFVWHAAGVTQGSTGRSRGAVAELTVPAALALWNSGTLTLARD